MKKLVLITLALAFALSAFAQDWPTPPAGEHPRLYLRASDIQDLKARMETPQGREILKKMRDNAVPRTAEEEAADKDFGFRRYFKMRGVTSEVQLLSLDYLTTGNVEAARRAIELTLDTLKHTNFGRKQDLSRASGVMLMTGAIVYDWCYDRLTAEEKQAFIDEFIRISKTMECGYPPKENEPIAGHSSEWMVLRDMLSAGIAVFDEYPDMYNYVLSLVTRKYVAPRNFFYEAGNYHQGTGYVTVRLTNDLIAQWIMTKMGAGPLFSLAQQNVLYDFIYRRRPDDCFIPAGDVNPIGNKGFVQNVSLPAMLAASYYNDPYLELEAEKKTSSIEPHCLILELLWRNFDLQAKRPFDLPLTRFSPKPFGWMIARSGWDAESVIVEMKVNENFVGNHQHLDGGSFQIYYHGPLAIDTGTYQGTSGGYNSPHAKNYFKRTIAHNSLLVYDPSEQFECYNYGGEGQTQTAVNDGGQRMPGKGWDTCRSFEDLLSESYTVGQTLAHSFGPNIKTPVYSYLKGDITKAYSGKVSDVRRSFVYLNTKDEYIPGVLIVFDHIVAADPSFKKYWLLHSIEKPQVKKNSFEVVRTKNGQDGMIHCDILTPCTIETVGGKGHEFEVFGENFPTERKDYNGEMGAWRVQLSPAKPAAEDVFLNVMQISKTSVGGFMPVKKIESDGVIGAVVGKTAVLFAKDGGLLGGKVKFNVKGAQNILVTDLEEGVWTIKCGGKVLRESVVVSDEKHCVYFAAQGSDYELIKQ